MDYAKSFFLLFLIRLLLFFNCTHPEETLDYIYNSESLYKDYLNIEKKYEIKMLHDDYQVTNIISMDADHENNLFVLNYDDASFYIFNNNGEFIRKLGEQGEGPQELKRPNTFDIHQNKIVISQEYGAIKIWDLSGKYLTKGIVDNGNRRRIISIPNKLYYIHYLTNLESRTRIYELISHSQDFKNKKLLLTYIKDAESEMYYIPDEAIAFTQKGGFYFPQDSKKYSITKFDPEGNPEFSFGREYKKIPFTKHAREAYSIGYKSRIGLDIKDLPNFPVVTRKILIDSKENIWIFTGETYEDYYTFNRSVFKVVGKNIEKDNKLKVNIDIFNKDGIWLDSINTQDLISKAFIKNDYFYTYSEISPVTGQQKVNVYKIKYKY